MAGSWQVIAATCNRVFGLFIGHTDHDGRYGSFFQNFLIKEWKKEKKAEKVRRVGITMGISCHTCHAFSVSGLGKRFRAIATCHLTCHELAAGELDRQDWPEWWRTA